MAKATSEVQANTQELESHKKRELLGLLVADLEDSSNGELDKNWRKEAQRRFQELKDGYAHGIPVNHVFAKLERRLG
jgi:hypothetical protein